MRPQTGTKRDPQPPQLEEILTADDLPAKHWKALYVVAIKRIARRDKAFAEALAKEFLRSVRVSRALRFPADPHMVR